MPRLSKHAAWIHNNLGIPACGSNRGMPGLLPVFNIQIVSKLLTRTPAINLTPCLSAKKSLYLSLSQNIFGSIFSQHKNIFHTFSAFLPAFFDLTFAFI
jgi:hypothetical protein